MAIPAENTLLVELHVPDFEIVKSFYGTLGFSVVWERKMSDREDYLVMQLDKNVLCFWPGNEHVYHQSYFKKFSKETVRGYGIEIVIQVKDVGNLYERAKKCGKITNELTMRPWGLKDFRMIDPFGFYLRVTEPHNILDKK